MKRSARLITLCATTAILLLAASCENPLIGLGDKVDLDIPDLSVTSHNNGDYVSGTFVMSGVFNDDFAGVTVEYSLDDGSTFSAASVDETDKTWTITINTLAYEDGEKNVILIIEDASGKEIEKRVLLYFDNTPPLVMITSPLSYGPAMNPPLNGDVSIRGEAIDQFGVDFIDFVVEKNSAPISFAESVDGTNSWILDFDSRDYISLGGDFTFHFYAVDRAGNESTYFYHAQDVKALNGDVSVGIIDLYTFDRGNSVTGISFSHVDLQNEQLDIGDPMELVIDQSLDLPVFPVIIPAPGVPAATNKFGSGLIASGLITDDEEGVNAATVEISVDGGPWTPVTSTTENPPSLNWTHDLSGLGDGIYNFVVRARDNLGAENTSDTVDFTIDSSFPSVSITAPDQGEFIDSDTFTITGTASDTTLVDNVMVTVGAAAPAAATSLSGDYDTWEYVATVPADGDYAIHVEAEDNSANIAYTDLQVSVDTEAPEATFLSPGAATSVNGAIVLRGVSDDNRQITKVELKFGDDPAALWEEQIGELYSWSETINTDLFANAVDATETGVGTNIWEFNVYARITDVAGNVLDTELAATPHTFFIDPDLDKPNVTVSFPTGDIDSFGSILPITGLANDDDGLHHIEMQLDLNGDGDFADLIEYWDGSSNTADDDFNDPFEDETQWYQIPGTSLWSYDLNRFGELNELFDDTLTEILVGVDGWDITARIRAVDTKDGVNPDIAGDYEEFTIYYDKTIPRIENLNYTSGEYVTGSFNLTADIVDDQQITTINLTTAHSGGSNLSTIYSWVDPAPQINSFALSEIIDTTAPPTDITSGILSVSIQVVDSSGFQTLRSINLNVDNIYPTDDPDGYTDPDADDLNGTAARVQGTAEDIGTVSGIDKIEAYFVNTSNDVYDPSTGATFPVGSIDFGAGSVPYPSGAGSAYKIVIDNPNEFGDDDTGLGDLDGFDESLTLAGSTYNWWAEFDSNVIPDGALTIHYVIFDNAGNANHYSLPGFVTNNKPTIDLVRVGSDVDLSDAVEGDEQFDYAGSFNARNFLFVDVTASDVVPGTIAAYEIILDPDGLVGGPQSESASTFTFDISTPGPWSDGATDILVRVTDSDGIVVEQTLSTVISNTDSIDPVVTVDPLAQSHVDDGHLELSPAWTTGIVEIDDADAKTSGSFILTGAVSDNQLINVVNVKIDDYDAGSGSGIEHRVAVWDTVTDTLISDDAAFTIDTQSISEDTGHEITWSYSWDSSGIANVADFDISIEFNADDHAARTDLDTIQVDVVPYISDINRAIQTFRTKYGKFIVQDQESGVVIAGYNLDVPLGGGQDASNYLRVYNTAGASFDTTTVAANPDTNSLTVNLSGVTHSGWLELRVNGIPAGNNENDNSLSTNKEDDGSGLGSTLWNDDRYLWAWEVGDSFDQSGNAEYPSMSIASDGTLYGAWTNYATSSAYYATTATRTAIFYMYDPAEFTDIYIDPTSGNSVNYVFLGNYYGGSGWSSDIGSGGAISVWNGDKGVPPIGTYDVTPAPSPPYQTSRSGNYNYFHRGEMLYHDQMLLQFRRPKIVRTGDEIHIVYFDDDTKSVKYAHIDANNTNNAEIPWVNIDGGSDVHDTAIVTNGGRSTAAGEYVSIDLDEAGNPVIMYYDISGTTLKLARSNGPIPTAAGDWNLQTVFIGDDPNSTFVGKYVDMKFDATGNLYAVASVTSAGDLLYITAANVDGTTTDYSFAYSEVIDSDGAVGGWGDLTLNGTTPYISYLNNSLIGTFGGLKVAYYDSGLGDWEHGIVPVNSGVTDNRTSIEYFAGGTWDVAVGYVSDTFDLAYFKPEE